LKMCTFIFSPGMKVKSVAATNFLTACSIAVTFRLVVGLYYNITPEFKKYTKICEKNLIFFYLSTRHFSPPHRVVSKWCSWYILI
jgi:hypothetical protein